jgi:hypothetical protein
MSARNGDRARFQKDRKRKLRKRQRLQEFVKARRAELSAPSSQNDKTAGGGAFLSPAAIPVTSSLKSAS